MTDGKAVVLELFRAFYWDSSALSLAGLVHDDVVVHAPDVGRGRTSLEQALSAMVVDSPRAAAARTGPMPEPALLVEEGDLVAVAWYLPQPEAADADGAYDFFLFTVARVQDGRIAEIWSSANLQHPAHGTWASYGDGRSRPLERSGSDLAAQKQLAVDFYRRVFDGEDAELAASFITDDYRQHAAHYPQGRDGLMQLLRLLFPDGPRPVPDTMTQPQEIVLSEGDIVITGGPVQQPDPRTPGRTYALYVFTAYAVRDGRLAEHWSGVDKGAPLHRVAS